MNAEQFAENLSEAERNEVMQVVLPDVFSHIKYRAGAYYDVCRGTAKGLANGKRVHVAWRAYIKYDKVEISMEHFNYIEP